jgi:hypothetical protein
MPHRLVFTCHRTGATGSYAYSQADLIQAYSAEDRAELAAGGTLHIRWPGMEPEHLTIHDASVPRRIPMTLENPQQIEARP